MTTNALPSAGPVLPLRELTVLFTGSVRGEIEVCGCPTVPYGGFRRRTRLLERLRMEDAPTFLLDAGEMLLKGMEAADTGDRAERARALLTLARATKLDAWAPAPLDLVPAGPKLLEGTNGISATLPGFPAATVLERGGVRLGVIGLSAPLPGTTLADPVGAVRTAMAGAGAADAWVVLSNAAPAVARAVAEGVPGLGAVLSTRGNEHDPPRKTAGAPIIETPERGRFLTVVRASLGSVPGPWTVVSGGVWEDVGQIRHRVPRMATPEARAAEKGRLDLARARLEAETAGRNLATAEDWPLGSDLDGDTTLDAPISAFKAQAQTAARERVAAERGADGYASAGTCTTCHRDRVVAWAYQPHAEAYEALVQRGSALDTECIGCHATGWGRPGGFADLTPAAMQTWKGVQCEACHGPLGGHPGGDAAPQPITEATCTGCHDPANSPQFDYATYLARISCTALSRQGDAAVPVRVGP